MRTALWPAGTFWSAFCRNREEAVQGVIDADAIAVAVRAVTARRTEWTGTFLGPSGRRMAALAEGEPMRENGPVLHAPTVTLMPMHADRLEVSVSFDPRQGYIASAPELKAPVTALSLHGLRRRLEARRLPDEPRAAPPPAAR